MAIQQGGDVRQLRVKGIVREANRIRQALSAPMLPAQLDALGRRRQESLRQIEAILSRNNALPRDLPAPSRRAYEFLKQADLGQVQLLDVPADPDQHPVAQPESVTYAGLRAFLDGVLNDIALSLDAGRFNAAATLRVISRTADRLDHAMRRDEVQPEHLKPEARSLVGWFRYFADEGAFNRYARAVRRAQSILGALPAARTGWQPPLLVHYRPSSHLYRWRVLGDGTRIILATPMIVFDEETLQALGRLMLGGKRHRPAVVAAMLAEPFQAVAVELETAAGIVEHTRGVSHDLAEAFDRVNREHFSGRLPRPRLAWTRTLSGTAFGHYDFVRDQVSVSSLLDQREVPAFVIDHVMHHELLHKKHGFKWQRSRQHTHTREFRVEEQTFPHYKEADRFLNEFGASSRELPQ